MLNSMKNLSLVAVAVVSLSHSVGCGRTSDGGVVGTPPAPVQCPVGQVYVPQLGQCVPGSTNYGYTNSLCGPLQGYSATFDQQDCQLLPAVNYYGYGYSIPYLPNENQTQTAWWGPTVTAGDQVILMGEIRYGRIGFGVLVGDCSSEQNASSIMRGAVSVSHFALPLGQPVTVNVSGTLRVGMAEQKECMETEGVFVKVLRLRR
ncbi:MAG: hypothetical protein ACK5QT_02345 [Oligoflexia bacterium]|jgi:hypothetical protein